MTIYWVGVLSRGYIDPKWCGVDRIVLPAGRFETAFDIICAAYRENYTVTEDCV